MESLDLVIDSKNRLQRADSVHVVCIAWLHYGRRKGNASIGLPQLNANEDCVSPVLRLNICGVSNKWVHTDRHCIA